MSYDRRIRRRAYALFFPLWLAAAALAQTAASSSLSHCSFHRLGNRFLGSCGALFDQTPMMALRPAAAITTGLWREDVHPVSVWAGDMSDRGYPNAPLELEVYKGGWGVLRTEYGWFPATHFAASASTMRFELDAAHEVPPNPLDEEIVRKAAAILSSDRVWNRADNRQCRHPATTWSLYCAMEKATIEVTGGFHHRRPALEVVRELVAERTASRNYHHRLMDYNNDPRTGLGDVQSLLQAALARMHRP